MDDQGLADGLRQGLAALAEVAVDLDQQPLGIDRDQHAAGVDHALEVLDRVPDGRSQEVAGHLVVVGLDDVGAVERRIADADQPGPAGRLRRRGPADGGELETERDPLAEPRDDPRPRDLTRLAGDRRRQARPGPSTRCGGS